MAESTCSNPENEIACAVGSLYPCAIQGQNDIYGLGIRIALYLQWFCTALAYLFDPPRAADFVAVNYVFSIAVAVNSIVNRGGVAQLEIPIIAVLIMLPPTVIVAETLGNIILYFRPPTKEPEEKTETQEAERPATAARTRTSATQTEAIQTEETLQLTERNKRLRIWVERGRDYSLLIATIFLLCVAAWELFDGVRDAMLNPQECQPMFIKSYYLNGRYNTFLRVISVIFAAVAPMFQIFLIIERVTLSHSTPEEESKISQRRKDWRTAYRQNSDRSPLRSMTKVLARPFKVRSFVALLWGIFMCFVIAQTETIIKQNKIQGLLSAADAGQLIPLIIGVLQFCIVSYDVIYQELFASPEWSQKKHTSIVRRVTDALMGGGLTSAAPRATRHTAQGP